ncbi:YdcF family protein [Clostridium grantii]|nr:YdcF family protein [Clostridium grantii]
MSSVLKQRLDKAIEIVDNNKKSFIIVSGGQGQGEDISEAQAMKKYLIGQGVPEEMILLEDKSTSTVENFQYSKQLIMKSDVKVPKILIITNDYHLYRAMLVAENSGLIVDGVSSKTPITVRINYLVREYYAVMKGIAKEF